ncbi:hypothetical protein BB558_000781 [Smittium angustum]|uniref:Reverse transcriptase zinc-binding domain-containing protein n=1 Tax=Smittium angustum TaxID=133377 RepID=A0A2U1JD76_SMIAN|nr:hypothetical protein BB558_000781 [Smittium angustum]
MKSLENINKETGLLSITQWNRIMDGRIPIRDIEFLSQKGTYNINDLLILSSKIYSNNQIVSLKYQGLNKEKYFGYEEREKMQKMLKFTLANICRTYTNEHIKVQKTKKSIREVMLKEIKATFAEETPVQYKPKWGKLGYIIIPEDKPYNWNRIKEAKTETKIKSHLWLILQYPIIKTKKVNIWNSDNEAKCETCGDLNEDIFYINSGCKRIKMFWNLVEDFITKISMKKAKNQ